MKKHFQAPVVLVIDFHPSDVITTSGGNGKQTIGITSTNTDFADKSRERGGSIWDD